MKFNSGDGIGEASLDSDLWDEARLENARADFHLILTRLFHLILELLEGLQVSKY